MKRPVGRGIGHRNGRGMKGNHLGEFEELVLLSVGMLYDEAYGVRVQEALAQEAGREASISAVHATLYRLEKKGLLRSEMGDPTPERGGRRKRLFRVTGAGEQALRETRALRDKLWGLLLDPALRGGGT